jgi:ornithine cyclodeaminase/alanine dehydrogenase-like protein (mu-crystallin family)
MDAARITAVRTAAVSGVALQTFAPDAPSAVALIGAGVQARSHVAVLAALAPDAALRIHDRHEDRAEAVAKLARAAGIARARAAPSPREACDGADIVITVASLGSGSQMLALDWLLATALVVAVDFATYASAELARTAARFVVDDRAQFLAYRDAGHFDGYPDPGGVLGEELVTAVEALGALEGPRGAPTGRVLVTHLGVGLADVVFADAIRKVAEGRGIGIELER